MSRMISVCFLLCVTVAADAEAPKGERRGLITTASCPYTCQMAGVSTNVCKEWRAGDTCYVEDLSQAPGHRSVVRIPGGRDQASDERLRPKASLNKRGLITSSSCPYDCARARVSPEFCREWQADGLCYVEDFTQAPGHRARMVVAD